MEMLPSPAAARELCCLPQGISDGIPLVQAVVPKNQAHSFITQGSPDVLVSMRQLEW